MIQTPQLVTNESKFEYIIHTYQNHIPGTHAKEMVQKNKITRKGQEMCLPIDRIIDEGQSRTINLSNNDRPINTPKTRYHETTR